MTGLTRTQWKLLGFIHGFISEHGYSPTLRQMCVGTGRASLSNMHRLIVILEDRGFIDRIRGGSTALTQTGVDHVKAHLSTVAA